MKHYGLDVAREALSRWTGDPVTLEHVATSGNAVYRFRAGDEPRILRITDTGYRSVAEQQAEMAFLLHLDSHDVRVSAPVASRSGARVEVLEGCSACVLTWAPGQRVDFGSALWDEAYLREWGASLARIHEASRTYEGPPRWDWWQEGLIADAPELIPRDDTASRAELERVMEHLRALPRERDTYGMTHADFGPQNFHYLPGAGITSFDFGNCCHHWFVSDLVISCSVLRRLADRERFRDWLLAGYRAVLPLPEHLWAEREWFARLRFLYVYLSRLAWFGPEPTADQQATLAGLRQLVGPSPNWP